MRVISYASGLLAPVGVELWCLLIFGLQNSVGRDPKGLYFDFAAIIIIG